MSYRCLISSLSVPLSLPPSLPPLSVCLPGSIISLYLSLFYRLYLFFLPREKAFSLFSMNSFFLSRFSFAFSAVTGRYRVCKNHDSTVGIRFGETHDAKCKMPGQLCSTNKPSEERWPPQRANYNNGQRTDVRTNIEMC